MKRITKDLAAARQASALLQERARRENDLINALQHIADVARADEPRDLPGIRKTALDAIKKSKEKP